MIEEEDEEEKEDEDPWRRDPYLPTWKAALRG